MSGMLGVKGGEIPFSVRIAKVFADPLRMRIMAELNTRAMSAKQFYEQFGGGSLSRVARHFEVLVQFGWLIKVAEKTGGMRRGATEHFYRATGVAELDTKTWSELPQPVKAVFTWKVFETLGVQVKEAMEAGTIDARPDRHFSWVTLLLDETGWSNVIQAVDSLYESLFEEQKRASARIEESGSDALRVTVALASFESPQETVKEP